MPTDIVYTGRIRASVQLALTSPISDEAWHKFYNQCFKAKMHWAALRGLPKSEYDKVVRLEAAASELRAAMRALSPSNPDDQSLANDEWRTYEMLAEQVGSHLFQISDYGSCVASYIGDLVKRAELVERSARQLLRELPVRKGNTDSSYRLFASAFVDLTETCGERSFRFNKSTGQYSGPIVNAALAAEILLPRPMRKKSAHAVGRYIKVGWEQKIKLRKS